MMNSQIIAVLGGAGYIGSHACLALARGGYQPVVIDNFSRGHREMCADYPFEPLDILDTAALTEAFMRYKPLAVMHFAALSEVAESVKYPELFYKNNVEGTASVLTAMSAAGVENIVFSSTAAVYGQPEGDLPIVEECALVPINPYGETKVAAEKLIQNKAGVRWVCLRYFNAAGADEGIGEAHFPESHLIPLVIQAALGMREDITIYGQDYPTPDGTCVRDYIHVMDLADAHVRALSYLLEGGESLICNLGTGKGNSVHEVIEAVREVSGDLSVRVSERRAGDPPFLVANYQMAERVLGWVPQRNLQEIVESAYKWHSSPAYMSLYKKGVL
jgi:UDP-glucose 4-epimerase